MFDPKQPWRVFIFANLILVLAFLGSPVLWAGEAALPPSHLRCEYLSDPLGIDTPQPRFFWVLEHARRGEKQSAYQVVVATTPEGLASDQGDQWDSGKVQSAESTQVVYQGKALKSGRDYYWKVRYWDKEGNPSPYSRIARFSMGLLSREEWKGSWIGGGSAEGNEFRKDFTVSGKIVRARAYVTALGYYELRVNGKKVGENVLDPAWTTYPKRVLYSTYDVSAALRQGSNTIGAMLGGGWATLGYASHGIKQYYKSPALLVQMNIELEDGRTISIASDGSWKTTRGPIVDDSVYNGEVYDARRETPGWDAPDFDDSGWTAAQVVEGSQGIRSAQMMPPIRVVDTLVPMRVTSPEAGVYVFDMGQNISGWARLRVRGPAGAKVTLRFAELLYGNGMINRENLRGAKSRDIYILRGDGLETYEPRFTYHGFRYVEVTGYPGTPSIDSLRGRVVHTAVDTTGSFLASKQILNDLQKAVRWSQQTNLFGIPTDCDQRDERQGWMGDAHITAEEAMLNFDMAAFYTNFIRDIRDAQAPDGSLPSTVPRKYGSFPADLGWETAYPLLSWYMWEQYGDRRVLEQNEPGLKSYVAFLRSLAVDNVFRGHLGHEGDWVETEHTPLDYMADVWYYYDVEILARMERVLGHPADAASYGQLAQEIKDALNRTFFNAQTGEYSNETQTANALALFLNLPATDQRGAVATNLTNDITYYHNTHTTTGFIGVKYLMPVLTDIGRSDLAYELAVQTTYPSWGYMLTRGATTLWELWEEKTGPGMNSHDHAMFSSVGAWFYQALGGINQEGDSAGYLHLRIEPQVVEDLTWASATVQTVRGAVSSSWTRTPSVLTLEVAIPVGADARVVIPKAKEFTDETIEEGGRVVWEKGRFISGDPGITNATEEESAFVLDVGSGDYSFKLTSE